MGTRGKREVGRQGAEPSRGRPGRSRGLRSAPRATALLCYGTRVWPFVLFGHWPLTDLRVGVTFLAGKLSLSHGHFPGKGRPRALGHQRSPPPRHLASARSGSCAVPLDPRLLCTEAHGLRCQRRPWCTGHTSSTPFPGNLQHGVLEALAATQE